MIIDVFTEAQHTQIKVHDDLRSIFTTQLSLSYITIDI